jgi:hypothetical protein
MELNEFLQKFLPDCEQKLEVWQKAYGNRPVTISQQKHEFYELHFPEALQNFADIYYKKIVENCPAEIIDIYYLEQPEIEELTINN